MRVYILAGGLGTRLRPLISDRPKCLAPVRDKPFLHYILARLAKYDLTEIVLLVGYLGGQVEEYFRDGRDLGLNLAYVNDEGRLGTAGALRHAASGCREPFLLLNGDTYLAVDYHALRQAHLKAGAWATLALARVPDCRRYGMVTFNCRNQILGFSEKGSSPGPGWINGGVYILEPELLASLSAEQPISLEKEVLPAALARENKLQGQKVRGTFVDIGVPEDYIRAQKMRLDW